jgi:pyridinium-3,5-biscarboxylic acid mononucleotide synthase
MSHKDAVLDLDRAARIGLDEAIFCSEKSASQIAGILEVAGGPERCVLLTRLSQEKLDQLPAGFRNALDYCDVSQTAYLGHPPPVVLRGKIAIVAAGTSDAKVATEAARTLRHAGVDATVVMDVGVAGIWRLMERVEELERHPVVIAVAGMDAALASVLGGLISSVLVCVPTSVGYGAAESGRTALNAMLSSCAPGLLVCNIDNGYGAACAAIRILNALKG